MKKIIRINFEECSGECHQYDDILYSLVSLDSINKLSFMHDKICNVEGFCFGIDQDVSKKLFVAYYTTPTAVELFCKNGFNAVVKDMYEFAAKDEQTLGIVKPANGVCSFTPTEHESPLHTFMLNHLALRG